MAESFLDLGLKVLIVDDVPSARLVVKTRLSQLGFSRIVEATNGLEALDILQKDQEIGLIISDWQMPQVQVPQRLNLGEEIPSILITTLDPEVDRKITESGFPRDRIFRLKNALPSYQQKYPKLRPFGQINLDQGLYVALALRDLACLSRHNDLGESFPDSMVGFKDFV